MSTNITQTELKNKLDYIIINPAEQSKSHITVLNCVQAPYNRNDGYVEQPPGNSGVHEVQHGAYRGPPTSYSRRICQDGRYREFFSSICYLLFLSFSLVVEKYFVRMYYIFIRMLI